MFININSQIFYIIFLFYFQVFDEKYIITSISGSSVILIILSFKMNENEDILFYFQVLTKKYIITSISGSSVILMIF